jgi:hypothetical protein
VGEVLSNSSKKNKIISVPQTFINASWGQFFSDQCITLIENGTEQEAQDKESYQIIDARVSKKLFLYNTNINYLLTSYFEKEDRMDLLDLFLDEYTEVYKIKIEDFLNLGNCVDSITLEAYKRKFPFVQIRSFLNLLFKNSFESIELIFGFTNQGFVIQALSPNGKIQIEDDLYLSCNFLDVSQYENKFHFHITAVWFISPELEDVHFYFQKIHFINSELSNFTGNNVAIDVVATPTKDYVQMEQQLVRLKELLYKLKNQMQSQAKSTEELNNENSQDQNLTAKVTELEAKNQSLEDEKKQLNARFQLATRKLQILDSNLERMGGKIRQDPEQEAEVELLKEQKNTLEKKLEFSMRTLDQTREQVKENEKEIELLKEQSVEKVSNFKSVSNNGELEKEIQLLKKIKIELEEKLNKALSNPVTTSAAPAPAPVAAPKPTASSAAQLLEIQKLNELKIANEAKIKEQFVENKKLEGRIKAQTVQLEGLLNKVASNTAAKNSENHSKQLEQASNRVAEVTKELQDKKKELVLMKQETTKLNARVYELEKKITYYEKKAA